MARNRILLFLHELLNLCFQINEHILYYNLLLDFKIISLKNFTCKKKKKEASTFLSNNGNKTKKIKNK